MTDLLFPPSARVSSQNVTPASNAASSRSIFTAATRSIARAGSRWRFGLRSLNTNEREIYSTRAVLQSFGFALDGQANRCFYMDPAYRKRGSFPAPELLQNADLSSTAGFSPVSCTLTVADRILRGTRTIPGANELDLIQNIGVTQYVPYAMRAFLHSLRVSGSGFFQMSGGTQFGPGNVLTAPGLTTIAAIPSTTVLPWFFYQSSSNTGIAGDYFELSYASMARCALVDNGPNDLQRSDEAENAYFSSSGLGSVTANSVVAPNGTSTADMLVQDTSSAGHYRFKTLTGYPSAAADYTISCAFKAANRSWAYVLMQEQTTSNSTYAFINLTTGALGTVIAGTNWGSARAFVVSLGNGWYRLHLVAQKTNAATSIQYRFGASTADNVQSYSGAAENAIAVWRFSGAPSSVPISATQTTSAASTGTAQTGRTINVKGLPVSTNGLLRFGDRVQIGNQLCMVTGSLNSDAAGLGALQLAYGPRTSPADNAPVIIKDPMGRFMLTGNEGGGWSDAPGRFSDFEFELEEALDQ